MKYFANFLVGCLVVAACETEERLTPDRGMSYFPLQTGWHWTYHVEEKRYSVASDPIELSYEVRAEVIDSFSSGDQLTYVIQRSRRTASTDDWESLDTWSARVEGNALIISEGNTAFVKLLFPLTAGSKWNGNAFNALGEDEYNVQGVRKPLEVGGMMFERTITVEQERNKDLIVFQDQRFEVYAENVGLIYKELIQLDYCTADECLGQQKVDEGVEMKMTIVDYGTL